MAYSDGSCNNKTGQKGGYGVVIKHKNLVKEFLGGRYDNTTSARMEILGALRAIEYIKPTFKVILHSDSEYVVKSFNEGWLMKWASLDFKTCKNPDLWKRMYEAYNRFPEGNLQFKWVKGHSGHLENERCDELATMAANRRNIIIDNHDWDIWCKC